MEELTTASGQRTNYRFPEHFLWGAATAAHQVEGENRWNDWWEYEQAGRLPHRSGACCSHYELYEQDFDLARDLGHNCHRISVEWSRIEPTEGQWDERALGHYKQVVQALRRRAIEPVLTLHHFTNPAWFTRRGGWLSRDCIQLFLRFVERVLDELSGDVRYWITINEPTVYVMQGYINGKWPPLEQRALLSAVRAARNLAGAHVAAYKAIKSRDPDFQVGLAHSALVIEPCDPQRRRDRLAAWTRNLALNRLFFWLIGERRRGRRSLNRNLDFIGLNYYTRCCVRSSGMGMGALVGRACKLPHHDRQGCFSSTNWEVYPTGLGATLSEFAQFGLPLFITENGIATDDDELRCEFLKQHLGELAGAMEDGVKIIGYLHWSLMDNFEWDMGYSPKFGLAATLPGTKQRIPRRSAELMAQICRENRY